MCIKDNLDITGDLIKGKVKTEIENEYISQNENIVEIIPEDMKSNDNSTEKELLENELRVILENCPNGVVVDEEKLKEELTTLELGLEYMEKEKIDGNEEEILDKETPVETEIEEEIVWDNTHAAENEDEVVDETPQVEIKPIVEIIPQSEVVNIQYPIPPQPSAPPPQFTKSIGKTTSKEGSVFKRASWIWAEGNDKKEDFVIFRKKFTLEKKPKEARVNISVCGFYHMFVNNKLVVYDGSLSQHENLNYGYFDTIDIAPYLAKGENVIGLVCVKTQKEHLGGMIFECGELDISSDSSFTVYRSPAYKIDGDKLIYDATLEGQIDHVFEAAYGASIFVPAREYSSYGSGYYFDLEQRKIPLFKFSSPLKGKRIAKDVNKSEAIYTYDLDGYYHFVPIISCNASSGQAIIEVKTDRQRAQDTKGRVHTNLAFDYICKDGPQTHECVMPLVGTKLIVKVPLSVKLSSIQFRITEFDLSNSEQDEVVGEIKLGKSIQRLNEKAIDTLRANMREIFSKTPECASKNTLSDFSAASQLASYALSDTALTLAKKCIEDMLAANLLTINKSLTRALLTISERGAISAYFGKTNDVQTLKKCLPQMLDLLNSVKTDSYGIAQLPNEYKETDIFYNVDEVVLLNAIFYSAMNFYISSQFSCGERENGDITRKRDLLKNNFETAFFKGKGYSSREYYDERANAWAVISNLANKEHTPHLINLLSSVQTSSPTFENYIIDALMMVGAKQRATKRLLNRYRALIDNEDNCLHADFFGGSICYVNSAGVVSNFYRHIAGVEFKEGKVFITPDFSHGNVDFVVSVPNGILKGNYSNGEATLNLKSACEAYLLMQDKGSIMKRVKLNKGKNKFQL